MKNEIWWKCDEIGFMAHMNLGKNFLPNFYRKKPNNSEEV